MKSMEVFFVGHPGMYMPIFLLVLHVFILTSKSYFSLSYYYYYYYYYYYFLNFIFK